MSIERGGSGVPGESPPIPGLGGTASVGVPPSMRLQILATEHWSLLASRSLAWNESFSRVGMFLSLLSGAIVALALVGQGSEFGTPFLVFGIVILPVVLFVGLTTYARLGASNYHDAQCVVGMNRIRAGYLEMAPDLERFFVMGIHDDAEGVGRTMALEPGASELVHQLASTPSVVGVVDSVLGAAIVGFAMLLVDAATAIVLAVAILTFVGSYVAHTGYGGRRMRRARAGMRPVFPSPPSP